MSDQPVSDQPVSDEPEPDQPGHNRTSSYIRSYRDALGVAVSSAKRWPQGQIAMLLDPLGRLCALYVHPEHPVHPEPAAPNDETALDTLVVWACRQPHRWPSPGGVGGRILFITNRDYQANTVYESDLRAFRLAGWSISNAGHRLVDWIETDGTDCRSYALITCPTSAWDGHLVHRI